MILLGTLNIFLFSFCVFMFMSSEISDLDYTDFYLCKVATKVIFFYWRVHAVF